MLFRSQVTGEQGFAKLETLFGFSPSGDRPKKPLQVWVKGEDQVLAVEGASDVMQPYQAQWDYFINSVRQGRGLRPELEDSMAQVGLIEAMYESATKLECAAGLFH